MFMNFCEPKWVIINEMTALFSKLHVIYATLGHPWHISLLSKRLLSRTNKLNMVVGLFWILFVHAVLDNATKLRAIHDQADRNELK
jgi:hypothetical protein